MCGKPTHTPGHVVLVADAWVLREPGQMLPMPQRVHVPVA